MRNYYLKFLLPFLLMTILSCDGFKYRLTEFSWVVVEVKIIKSNQLYELAYNMIIFQKNGECQLPEILWDEGKSKATWEYINEGKNRFVIIKSNNVFNGKYTYYLENDPTTYWKMILLSDSLEITCAPSRFSSVK